MHPMLSFQDMYSLMLDPLQMAKVSLTAGLHARQAVMEYRQLRWKPTVQTH